MMLDTTIKFNKAFKRMEEEDLYFLREIDNDPPEDEDWENVIILSKFLRRFYDATKMMSDSSYVTSNHYFEEIAKLYKYLNNAANSLDPKLQAMGLKMKKKFDKYYRSLNKVNMMALIAVALDPTKKLNYVKFCFEQIYDDEAKIDEMHDKVNVALENLYKSYERSFVGSSSKGKFGDSRLSNSSSASNVDIDDNDCEFDAWHKSFIHVKKKVLDENKYELDRYLEAESEDILNIYLLMWWKSTGSKYEIVSLMA